MFKVEYQTHDGVISWLRTEYPDPDDADRIAKHLIDRTGEVTRTTVVEQDGTVYSQWVQA